jgi:hypothetical protein
MTDIHSEDGSSVPSIARMEFFDVLKKTDVFPRFLRFRSFQDQLCSVYVDFIDHAVFEFLSFAHYVFYGNVVTLDFSVYYIFEESFPVEDYVEFAHLDSSLESYILGYKGFALSHNEVVYAKKLRRRGKKILLHVMPCLVPGFEFRTR